MQKTKELTFSKQFPSLDGLSCDTRLNARRKLERVFTQDDIEQYCLDKQKVREIIDNTFTSNIDYMFKDRIKKRLGL